MDEAIIYTDGSSGQNRHGGWAAIIITPLSIVEISGSETDTTNNRMEMLAAIKGLQELHTPHEVYLVSDSAYLLNALRGGWFLRWIEDEANWNSLGFSYDRPNMDLWHILKDLNELHHIVCVKVKGHTGDLWNEKADKAAKAARIEQSSTKRSLHKELNGDTVT